MNVESSFSMEVSQMVEQAGGRPGENFSPPGPPPLLPPSPLGGAGQGAPGLATATPCLHSGTLRGASPPLDPPSARWPGPTRENRG